jgi:magnesium-transporting ATPase (P-type)
LQQVEALWPGLMETVAVPLPEPSAVFGLATTEAESRLARDGPNELAGAHLRALDLLVLSFGARCSGFCWPQTAAAIGVGEQTDGAIIIAIMSLSVGLAFLDEYPNEQTLAVWRERAGRRATVLRNGRAIELPAADLVVDDVRVLQCSPSVSWRSRIWATPTSSSSDKTGT